jgi:hypothetical protein
VLNCFAGKDLERDAGAQQVQACDLPVWLERDPELARPDGHAAPRLLFVTLIAIVVIARRSLRVTKRSALHDRNLRNAF